MKLQILKSKLHRVTITNTHLNYEGSCAIDSEILKVAQINEYEMIHIYNLQNGERFSTYAIKAEAGSRVVTLNGAAAFKGSKNDKVIICTYAYLDDVEIKKHKPTLVYFKEGVNIINEIKSSIKIQKNNIVNL